MNTLYARVQAYAQESHPLKDTIIFILSLLLVVSVDLTAYPETLAVLVYQLFLLAAVLSVIHLAVMSYRQRRNS